jgi:hypothetical protein
MKSGSWKESGVRSSEFQKMNSRLNEKNVMLDEHIKKVSMGADGMKVFRGWMDEKWVTEGIGSQIDRPSMVGVAMDNILGGRWMSSHTFQENLLPP